MVNGALDTETGTSLSCYDCGHAYWYLGKGVHQGECPQCGSRLVTPAGDLRIVTSQSADTDDPAAVQLTGTDDSGRLFQYWFRTDTDHEAVCTRIDVCGYSLELDPDADWPPELFPPSVGDDDRLGA
ncbi:hypothetical protein SAMN04487948_1116 [Halogranum amylolyticum]|uniref:Uncharacterized protein n=1 Tax=Halogranum amylolyticum TaxID=660520 RepID=A0A1H8UGB2_9EURY|nr:hypothetical protein SAMN04487948_1116 [Halogranum amylolyticum]